MKGSKEEVITWQITGFKYTDIKILPVFAAVTGEQCCLLFLGCVKMM